MNYDHMAIGFIIGFVIGQLTRHRDAALKFLATLVLVLASDAAGAQQQRTFTDNMGRNIGSATTDSQGSTTFRDSSGRVTGRASTDSQGTTTLRDANGRVTGKATGGKR